MNTPSVQRVFLSLVLTTLLCWSAPIMAAHAFDMDSLNPMHLLESPQEVAVKKAKKAQAEAEEAQRRATEAADQARKKAAYADQAAQREALLAKEAAQREATQAEAVKQSTQREAELARLAAERASRQAASSAVDNSQQAETKPVTKTQVKNESTPNTAAVSGNEKRSMWNPLNWVRGSEEGKEASSANNRDKAKPVVREFQGNASQTPEQSVGAVNVLAKSSDSGDTAATDEKTPVTDDPRIVAEREQQEYLNIAKKMRAAEVQTQRGNIVFELYPDEAPLTVANFVKLTQQGFYNQSSMKFHRVIPGFVVQTGDPTGTGAGGSKDRIPLEVKNKLTHDAKGVVAMARGASPNSATSQFYITLAPQKSLDAKYAIFGRVISGYDVLDKIERDDKVYGVRLVDLSTVTRDPESEGKKGFLKRLL